MRKAPLSSAPMHFRKKSDIEKVTTVLQFGHFERVFSSLLGSLDKGGIPKVVPPLYEEGPPQAKPERALLKVRPQKLTTVLQFCSFRDLFVTCGAPG